MQHSMEIPITKQTLIIIPPGTYYFIIMSLSQFRSATWGLMEPASHISLMSLVPEHQTADVLTQ